VGGNAPSLRRHAVDHYSLTAVRGKFELAFTDIHRKLRAPED
jgi:hypothetical protein